jgi:hypothetical protein
MHSMSSLAAKGVSSSTTPNSDSWFDDNISVTDRYLAQLAGGDEYLIYARWHLLPVSNRMMADLELVQIRLQIRWLSTICHPH